jgi:tetratricopeptide (TPR) repeat protein
MDRSVYNDPLLAEVAEDVTMVRIDIDRPEGRALAARFGVAQYPTLIYLAPDGRETLRWPGPLSLRDTRINLGQLAVPAAGRGMIEAARTSRPDDLATQSRALLWYGMRGEVERVRAIVDTLEQRLPGGAPGSTTAPRATDRAILRLNLAKSEELAGRRERALAAYRAAEAAEPAGAYAWRAWLGISTCLEAAGDGSGAVAAAARALALNPQRWLHARTERVALAARLPALPVPPGVDAP